VPLIVNGWTLLFHDQILNQIRNLAAARDRAQAANAEGFRSNASVRTLASIAKLVRRVIPMNPGHTDYRIGNTMGPDYRHWYRGKFGQRFRLFYRFDSSAKIIVFAWVNDEGTLRARGSRSDPYHVFKAMLDRDNPPDEWSKLLESGKDLPDDLLRAFEDAPG